MLDWTGLCTWVYRAASFKLLPHLEGDEKHRLHGCMYLSFFSSPGFVYLIQDHTYSSLRIHKLDFFLEWFLLKLFLLACTFPKVVLVSHNNLVVSTFAQNMGEKFNTSFFRDGWKTTSYIFWENTLIKDSAIVSGIWLLLWKIPIWTKNSRSTGQWDKAWRNMLSLATLTWKGNAES